MSLQLGPGTSAAFTGPTIPVHEEDGRFWAECPVCPGWSAAADTWEDLFRLVDEFHDSAEANHRGWLMLPVWTLTETSA